eukprot:m.321440 g.321440  ORF g.321440 m.321440 type:complete len:79 (-) comp77009_c0_seq1:113-349(-)
MRTSNLYAKQPIIEHVEVNNLRISTYFMNMLIQIFVTVSIKHTHHKAFIFSTCLLNHSHVSWLKNAQCHSTFRQKVRR